jgi:hypothetical protein
MEMTMVRRKVDKQLVAAQEDEHKITQLTSPCEKTYFQCSASDGD